MDKQNYLNALQSAWCQCQQCPMLVPGRRNVVFGYGNPDAQIMIIGEAPGENEDLSGFPFVGKAGLLLDQFLGVVTAREEVSTVLSTLNGIKGASAAAEQQRNEYRIRLRELLLQEFYFCNVVMCRPPENRDPTPDEMAACRTRLLEQIYTVDPVLIITAGRIATEALLQKKVAITVSRGEIFDIEFQGRGVPFTYTMMAVLHPSYLARVNDFRQEGGETWKTRNDLLRAMHLIDRYNLHHFGVPLPKLRPPVQKR